MELTHINYFITLETQEPKRINKIIQAIQADWNEFSIDFKIERNDLTKCISLSRNQAIEKLYNSLMNYGKCWKDVEDTNDQFLRNFIQGLKKSEGGVSCADIDKVKEYFRCIDNYYLLNGTIEMYQTEVDLLYNHNNFLSSRINKCQIDIQRIIINTLLDSTNEINQCIEKNTTFIDLINFIVSAEIIREAPLNLYENQRILLDGVKSREALEEINSKRTANYTNIIYNIQNKKNISVFCCLNRPFVQNNVTTQKAINEFDKCLRNQTTKLEHIVVDSILKEPWINNISQICHGGIKFENATSIFACLEVVWLYDSDSYNEIYDKVVEKLKKNRISLSLEIYGCLYPAIDDFNRRINSASYHFANCIRNQKLNSPCSIEPFHSHELNN